MGSSKWNCISAFKLKSVSVTGRMETERKKQSPKRRQVLNTHVGARNSLKLPDGLIGMRCWLMMTPRAQVGGHFKIQ